MWHVESSAQTVAKVSFGLSRWEILAYQNRVFCFVQNNGVTFKGRAMGTHLLALS